jgi:hypothetical protein
MKYLPGGRVRWAALAAVIAVFASIGGAFAAYPDSNVAHYTGCLTAGGGGGGQINSVAISDTTPKNPCGPNQVLVHLSGGDITKVTAGTGLTGGGDNGDVPIGLDPAYSLPQSCNSGEFPDWGGQSWQCFAAGTGLSADTNGKTLGIANSYQLPQTCSEGQIAKSGGQNTAWSCADETSYSGSDFALSNQSCGTGQFVKGINAAGVAQCVTDRTYGGADFALSNQSCTTGQFVTGISSSGLPVCSGLPALKFMTVESQDTCGPSESCGVSMDCPSGLDAAVGGYELSFTGTPGVPVAYINEPSPSGHSWNIAVAAATPGNGTITLEGRAICVRGGIVSN